MRYWEVGCRVEKTPEAPCPAYTHGTLGFERPPNYHEVKQKLAESYPRLELKGITRSYDASGKAEWLMKYYGHTV